jgi:hypothetical protein
VKEVEVTEATSLEKVSREDLSKNPKLPIKRNFSEMAVDSKESSSRKRLLRLYSDDSQKSEKSEEDLRKVRRKTQ